MKGTFHYVYILISVKDRKFYTGYTANLTERFEQHTKGRVSSTAERRPLKLVYYEACQSKKDAVHRERYLKSYHGKQFLHKRLKSYLTG